MIGLLRAHRRHPLASLDPRVLLSAIFRRFLPFIVSPSFRSAFTLLFVSLGPLPAVSPLMGGIAIGVMQLSPL